MKKSKKQEKAGAHEKVKSVSPTATTAETSTVVQVSTSSAMATSSTAMDTSKGSSSTATACSPSKRANGGSGFLSPKKSKEEKPLIAYVHQLSPVKRNRKDTMDYCTLLLQTGESSTKEALLYSKSKRSLLDESETSRTPVKLQRFTLTEDGKKVVINDMTNITQPLPTEYEFQFQLPSLDRFPRRTAAEVKEINDWELISFSGKVLNKGRSRIVGAKNLELAECTFADSSGSIIMSVWSDMIAKVEVGHVYSLVPVQVKSWNGIKKLSTTTSSILSEVNGDEELSGIPVPQPSEGSNTESEVALAVESIHNINCVETVVYCVRCQRRLLQAVGGKFVQCPRCSSFMRPSDCLKKMRVQLAVVSGEDMVVLSAFEEVLGDVCPSVAKLSEAALAEHLLGLNNLNIVYDEATRIISKLSFT